MSRFQSPNIRAYRWVVFLAALFYFFYQFTQTDLAKFGIQFRFLTIWGLTFNLVVAWLMLSQSLGRSTRDWNALVSATAVLGGIVVFMYWKLWFIDPALVNSGGPIVWYQEYYLHAAGPLLMWIDAFLILGAFRRIPQTLVLMLAIFVAYILWIEFAVQPLNDAPAGSATSGLPYPFLNDMETPARWTFYATTIGTAVVFMGIGWVISRLLKVGR